MKTFYISVTETLKRTVEVNATDVCDAIQKISDAYQDEQEVSMQYYLDGKQISFEQLANVLEEVDREANRDDICWRITVCNVHDDRLYFVIERFENC